MDFDRYNGIVRRAVVKRTAEEMARDAENQALAAMLGREPSRVPHRSPTPLPAKWREAKGQAAMEAPQKAEARLEATPADGNAASDGKREDR